MGRYGYQEMNREELERAFKEAKKDSEQYEGIIEKCRKRKALLEKITFPLLILAPVCFVYMGVKGLPPLPLLVFCILVEAVLVLDVISYFTVSRLSFAKTAWRNAYSGRKLKEISMADMATDKVEEIPLYVPIIAVAVQLWYIPAVILAIASLVKGTNLVSSETQSSSDLIDICGGLVNFLPLSIAAMVIPFVFAMRALPVLMSKLFGKIFKTEDTSSEK